MEFIRINDSSLRKQFISAWEVAFERSLDQTIYDWIFQDRNAVFGVIDENTMVGGYCLLKYSAWYKGNLRKGLLCNNVFINGYKYHKAGAFGLITDYAIKEMRQENHDFAIGFPNEKAIKAHLRSGWNEDHPVAFYELKPREWQYQNSNITEPTIVVFASDDPQLANKLVDLQALQDVSLRQYDYSCYKDTDFLTWRYLKNPRYIYDFVLSYSHGGDLTSACICKYYPGNKRVHLVDYINNHAADFGSIIGSIIKRYQDKSVEMIDCWVAQADSVTFAEYGFQKSERFSYCITRGLQVQDFHIGSSSHIVLGDNDVY